MPAGSERGRAVLEPDAPDRRGGPQPEEPLARRRHDGHLHREQVPVNVADPDPGSGMEKNPDLESGMDIPDHISESIETIFWVKIT